MTPRNPQRQTKTIPRGRSDPRRAGLRRANKEMGKSNAVMYSIIGFVVVVCIGFGFRLLKKSDDSGDIKRQMHELIHQADFYAGNSQYLDDKIEEHHNSVFDHTYRMGGRHTSSKFNADEYIIQMLKVLADDAKRDGKKELAQSLTN